MGYYVEQVEGAYKSDWDKAKETINGPVNTFYNTFKSIIEENEFPSKAEERWTAMVEKIKSLSTELDTKITTKYGEMVSSAKAFDSWYEELKALEGDPGGGAGLQFAIDKGFGRWVGSYSARGLVGIDYRTSKIYRWTAYQSVSIDTTGYIKIDMCRRELKKATNEVGTSWIEYEKILNTQSVQIKSQEDCAKYGKAGIKGDMLTTDSN